jgi:hypothetical protein
MEVCLEESVLSSFGIVLHAGVNTLVAYLDVENSYEALRGFSIFQ